MTAIVAMNHETVPPVGAVFTGSEIHCVRTMCSSVVRRPYRVASARDWAYVPHQFGVGIIPTLRRSRVPDRYLMPILCEPPGTLAVDPWHHGKYTSAT